MFRVFRKDFPQPLPGVLARGHRTQFDFWMGQKEPDQRFPRIAGGPDDGDFFHGWLYPFCRSSTTVRTGIPVRPPASLKIAAADLRRRIWEFRLNRQQRLLSLAILEPLA